MNKSVIVVCVAILVVALHCAVCSSLSPSKNVRNVLSDEGLVTLRSGDSLRFLPIWTTLKNEKYSLDRSPLKRVTRQTYHAQTSIYPNLPSGPPYGSYSSYNQHNSQPGYGTTGSYSQSSQPTSWQPNGQTSYNNPYGTNNYTRPGYPSYNPINNPSRPSGQYPQQPNYGQQPNYNSPYGANSQLGNISRPGYPVSNGYKPSNYSYNPSGPYGQSTPPNSRPNPYSSNNGQPSYGSSGSYPYPGYKPLNTSYNPSNRPPYYQPGQYNNSYSSYPFYTTTPSPYPGYPSQRPPYYPGQSLNNTYGRQPPYNPQIGQNTQHFNTYPGSPGYGQQNSASPYNPSQKLPYPNSPYGQYSPNNYPGQSSNAATFNLANSGYRPSIPNRPPYGSPNGNGPYGYNSQYQFQYPNSSSQDPTRVSPQYFNSV